MSDKYDISFRYSVTGSPMGSSPAPAPPPPTPTVSIAVHWRDRVAVLWGMLAGIATLLGLWAHLQIGLNNDHMTLMDQARRMMEGQIPYVDYTDIGPPFIHLIYTVPLILAKLTGWPIHISLYLLTYTLIAIGLIASHQMLKASGASRRVRGVILGAMAVALLPVALINQVFADREHLMITFAASWFVLYSPLVRREAVPVFWRLLVAVLAGIGFAIKPYFYVFYLATVGFAVCYGSTVWSLMRQFEHYVVGAIALAYLVAVFVFFPEYPNTVMPVGLKTYAAISWTGPDKTKEILNTLILGYGLTGFLGVFALWIAAPKERARELTYLFFLLLAAIASYLLNGGWYYTQYPFYSLAFVLAIAAGTRLVAVATEIRDRRSGLRWLVATCAVIGIGLYAFYVSPAIWRAGWDLKLQREEGHTLSTVDIHYEVRPKIDAHLDKHPRFMFLSTNLWSVNLLREGSPRRNVGRFDYLWPLPGILQMKDNAAQQQDYENLRKWITASVGEDLEKHKPELVIVDISPYQRSLPTSYDLLTFMKAEPRFAEAWKRYTQVDKLNACNDSNNANCAYEVYYRK